MNNGYNSVLKQTTHPTKKWTEDLNRYFSKKDIQMANGHMKRCSISLIVREMQIKSTMRHQFTLARIIILKSMNSKCWKVCGEKGTRLHCWEKKSYPRIYCNQRINVSSHHLNITGQKWYTTLH